MKKFEIQNAAVSLIRDAGRLTTQQVTNRLRANERFASVAYDSVYKSLCGAEKRGLLTSVKERRSYGMGTPLRFFSIAA